MGGHPESAWLRAGRAGQADPAIRTRSAPVLLGCSKLLLGERDLKLHLSISPLAAGPRGGRSTSSGPLLHSCATQSSGGAGGLGDFQGQMS